MPAAKLNAKKPGKNANPRSRSLGSRAARAAARDWQLYIMLLPAVVMVFVFCYMPMYGVQIAFRNFKANLGIVKSPWVGFEHFNAFFKSYYFGRLISNTLLLNVFGLLWGFPFPIVMALLINQMNSGAFRKFTQTAIYAPHFISPVVITGMLFLFLSPNSGLVNKVITALGGKPGNFMLETSWFRPLFIGTDIWQHAGWNTILYIAMLTAIDPGLYEAATMDGATKWQKILFIDVPHLVPIIVMLFILNMGSLLVSNTDKAYLLQTPGNIPKSDIIGVYVFRMGILRAGQFSYTAAIGLFTNLVNFIVIVAVNQVAKLFNETTLF